MKPTVSIIIPVLNEEHVFPDLLDDLLASTDHIHEIIVVDGGSTDRSRELLLSYPSVVMLQEQPGIARQRNKGADIATGEILLFLDADSRVSPKQYQELIDEFTKRHLHAACPTFIPLTTSLTIKRIYQIFNTIFKHTSKIVPSGAGMAFIIYRDIFHDHTGFDTAMLYEDIEFIRRVGKRHRYRTLKASVHVSDRRFRRDGVYNTFLLYLKLSVFFALGRFKQANAVTYKYGNYINR
ncbi:glycosyltransferase [candidate division WWE3 bacterium]|nr:glycosyltransferase [candidate division WWE3 bacterium]